VKKHMAGAKSDEAQIAASRQQVQQSFILFAADARDALAELPENELLLLLSLRKGLRRWRLDHTDWLSLAKILTTEEEDGFWRAAALKRLVLSVRLRGKLINEVKAARRNPFMLNTLSAGTLNLPDDDVSLLLDRWTSLPQLTVKRVLHRIMRYGRLRDTGSHSNLVQVRAVQCQCCLLLLAVLPTGALLIVACTARCTQKIGCSSPNNCKTVHTVPSRNVCQPFNCIRQTADVQLTQSTRSPAS
jgi:hypothetical protein